MKQFVLILSLAWFSSFISYESRASGSLCADTFRPSTVTSVIDGKTTKAKTLVQRVSSFFQQTTRFAERLALKIVGALTANEQYKQLTLSTPDSRETYEFEMGKRLGYGMFGSVYELNGLRRLSEAGQDASLGRDLVIKFPHTLSASRNSKIKFTESEMQREEELFEIIQESLAAKYGSTRPFPVVPILKTLKTTRGTLVLKPKVSGLDIGKLGRTTNYKVTPKIEQSLATIHDFRVRVDQSLKEYLVRNPNRWSYLSGSKWTLDINPRNLVWLDSEEVLRLKKLGIDLPFDEGFVLFELGFRVWMRPATLSEFLAEFESGLRVFAKRAN